MIELAHEAQLLQKERWLIEVLHLYKNITTLLSTYFTYFTQWGLDYWLWGEDNVLDMITSLTI